MNKREKIGQKINRYAKKVFVTLVLKGTISAAFLAGVSCGSAKYDKQFREVWDIVKDEHVNPPSEDEMFYGAMKGLVESLDDPYSHFMTPQEAAEYNKRDAGEFVGIGIQYSSRGEQVRIIRVIPDGPAEKAGLQCGDVILAADKNNLAGLAAEEISKKLRGAAGTQVTLTVSRAEWSEPQDIVIVRAEFVFPSVTCSAQPDNVVYVKIEQFNDPVLDGLDQCIERFVNESTAGIVLDMRDNPGGSLDVSEFVASEWLPKNFLVYRLKPRKGFTQRGWSMGEHRLLGLKTVILVNKNSASASEIVAGALQDYERAIVIGEKTHGKGVGQYSYSFPDGSLLMLVTFQWYTPYGRSISETGITPDIEVKVDSDQADCDSDPMLDKALEVLKQQAPDKE